MAGISSKAAGKLENKFKFNEGTELNNDLDINFYETDFRTLDPQLGRFHQIDPLGELFENESLYSFAGNNPINYNDPYGLAKSKDSASLAKPEPKPKPPAPAPPPASLGAVQPLPINPSQPGPNLVPPPEPALPTQSPGKIIRMHEPAPLPWGWVLSRFLGTIGGLSIPIPTGEGASLPDQIRDEFLNRNMVTLYRGVHNGHPDIANARNGMAVPWGLDGGHSNARDHNLGALYSVYTSWTIYKNVAAQMAGRKGWGGIILTKRFHVSKLTISPDLFFQGEFLIRGIVNGAIPQNARPYFIR